MRNPETRCMRTHLIKMARHSLCVSGKRYRRIGRERGTPITRLGFNVCREHMQTMTGAVTRGQARFARNNDEEIVTSSSMIAPSRRRLFKITAGAAALGAQARGGTVALIDRVSASPELRTLAQARNILFGAAAVSRVLNSDPVMAAIYAREAAL